MINYFFYLTWTFTAPFFNIHIKITTFVRVHAFDIFILLSSFFNFTTFRRVISCHSRFQGYVTLGSDKLAEIINRLIEKKNTRAALSQKKHEYLWTYLLTIADGILFESNFRANVSARNTLIYQIFILLCLTFHSRDVLFSCGYIRAQSIYPACLCAWLPVAYSPVKCFLFGISTRRTNER